LVALAVGVSVCPIRSTAAGPPSAIIQARAGDPNRAAWQAFHEKDFPRSERLAREAWQKAETERDALQAAFAAANLAAAVAMRGRLDEAIEWSHRAEERLGPGRQPPVRGRILVAQGILQKVRGEDEASEQAFARDRRSVVRTGPSPSPRRSPGDTTGRTWAQPCRG
jgi:ATP/maltotriose-dependent transcriptional regulator MalT